MKNIRYIENVLLRNGYAENGDDRFEIALDDNAIALGLDLRLDVTIATAADPMLYRASGAISNLDVTISGGDKVISNMNGYGLHLLSQMYNKAKGRNSIHSAVGANQILEFSGIVPMGVATNEGTKLFGELEYAPDTELDGEDSGTITINSGVLKVYVIKGWLFDRTRVQNFTFGDIAGGPHQMWAQFPGWYLAGLGFYPDNNNAGNEYQLLTELDWKNGARSIVHLYDQSLYSYGAWCSGGGAMWNDNYLDGAYVLARDDPRYHGYCIEPPRQKISARGSKALVFRTGMGAAENVHGFWYVVDRVNQPSPTEGTEIAGSGPEPKGQVVV